MAQEHDSTFSTHHLAAETILKPFETTHSCAEGPPTSCTNHASSTSQTRPQQSSEPVTKRVLSGLKDAVVTLARICSHGASFNSAELLEAIPTLLYSVGCGLSPAQDLNAQQSCAPTPQSPRAKPEQSGLRKQSQPESCESWAMVPHSGTWRYMRYVLSYMIYVCYRIFMDFHLD